MYTMMKPASTMSGDLCPTSDGSMGSMGGPGGPNGGPSSGGSGPGGGGPPGPPSGSGNNGGSSSIINGENIEMKSSPGNGPGTPREDSSGNMGDYGMGFGSNGGNVSKIKVP